MITLSEIERLTQQFSDLDYDPSQDGWVCALHGNDNCTAKECSSLVPLYPITEINDTLHEFTLWAREQYAHITNDADVRETELPDAAFDSYNLSQWPLGKMLDALHHIERKENL